MNVTAGNVIVFSHRSQVRCATVRPPRPARRVGVNNLPKVVA